MNTSEVLNKAADAIERDGWTQGTFGFDHQGLLTNQPLCLQGAIAAAMRRPLTHVSVNTCGAAAAVREYLAMPVFRSDLDYCMVPDISVRRPLWMWNDEEGRTAQQVIETLRAAAIIAAAKETEVVVVTPARESVTSC